MGDDFLVLDGDVAPKTRRSTPAPAVPGYLEKTYAWAYLNPRNVRLLDRPFVVSTILWGNCAPTGRETYLEDAASTVSFECSDVDSAGGGLAGPGAVPQAACTERRHGN